MSVETKWLTWPWKRKSTLPLSNCRERFLRSIINYYHSARCEIKHRPFGTCMPRVNEFLFMKCIIKCSDSPGVVVVEGAGEREATTEYVEEIDQVTNGG